MNEILKQNKTAFYVFDVKTLKDRVAYLRKMLPEDVAICYAIKANTFITAELENDVDRFEICSPGEAEICDLLDIPDKMMVISGVYKTPEVMENMVANGSQFGINSEEIEEIISKRNEFEYLDILGIQFFSGTQKTSLKKLKREIDKLDNLLILLKEKYDYSAEELEYGTGFPATYFKEDTINEDELIGGFAQLLNEMTSKPKITLELGRSIAAICGKYYTHIVDKKCNKGENYLLVDGGMNHIVYYGQHMAMKQPYLSVCGKETEPCTESWNICGSLCSMNDIIAKQISLPDIEIGDVICFENTGAYCMTEGISLFLSRDIPSVYIKKEDGTYLCVRDSFETFNLNKPNYRKETN